MPTEISARDLAVEIENGQPIFLLDVRQPSENERARLPGSVLIPLNELAARAAEIPDDPQTVIVAYCHHGIRSLNAAVFLRRLGHENVRSLAGGIDAWSCDVDPQVPRY